MPRRPKTHKPISERKDQPKRSSTALGYGRTWQKLREVYLNTNPSCEECLKHGRAVPATMVDHIRPHNGEPELLLDESNLQSLCHSCHSRKTVLEDGGFGNARKHQGARHAEPAGPGPGQSWI